MDANAGDRLLDEIVAAPPATPEQIEGARSPRLRYRHEALIDLIIAQPWLTQNQLAAHFGYTASWISTIMCSDAFQSALAARKDEIIDPALKASVEDQLRGVLARSLEIVRRKLDGPPENVDPQIALRAMELSQRALGYGARPPEPPKQGDLHVHLESLGDNLVVLLRKTKAQEQGSTIDGELNEPQVASGNQR